MRPTLLAALLMLPAASLAQAQTPVECRQVLDITNWSSEFSRGYFTNRVDLRNISQGRIAVTHRFSDGGEIISPASELAPNGFTRRELARTANRLAVSALQSKTTLTCVVMP
ncbi:hypothetical protein [Roseococcus sp. YIM B11640]|uniref:hypothetical protein n=1 Tax=Roseococcus sp. YIM B11640 TaxID=3133973 RepID=UPI003C7DC068